MKDPRPEPEREPDKPLMRSLGEFFGHIVQGIKSDVDPKKSVTKQTIEEETRQTPQGPVILRRTIIEEVQLPPADKQ
ncbi:MAG TPA: hypothetical protein VD997_17365 [Phycisphaerales bacterium]|nr:hypothetical protein [Phycisphaerales bacterium]